MPKPWGRKGAILERIAGKGSVRGPCEGSGAAIAA